MSVVLWVCAAAGVVAVVALSLALWALIHSYRSNSAKASRTDSKVTNRAASSTDPADVDHTERVPWMKVALMVFAYNEDVYLDEWVRHHVEVVGVDVIYFCDDESNDKTREVLQPWIDRGYVQYFHWSLEMAKYGGGLWSRNPDHNPYAALCRRLLGQHIWLAGIDTDEFVVVKHPSLSLRELLCRHTQTSDLVVMNWKVFGGQAHHLDPQCGVTQAFVRHYPADSERSRIVKSWINLYRWPHTHAANQPPRFTISHGPNRAHGIVYFDGSPAQMPYSPARWDEVCLFHYQYKSFQSFRQRKHQKLLERKNKHNAYPLSYYFRCACNSNAHASVDTTLLSPDRKGVPEPSRALEWEAFCDRLNLQPKSLANALTHLFDDSGRVHPEATFCTVSGCEDPQQPWDERWNCPSDTHDCT